MKTHALAPHLQRFFTERLGTQLKASPNTIISYRDTFRLLLKFAAGRLQTGNRPRFNWRTSTRSLSARSWPTSRRRAATLPEAGIRGWRQSVRSSTAVAVNEPQLLHHSQRVLAMPSKRHEKRAVDYLTRAEIEAVIAAPDLSTWHGRRDRAMLVLALQTGLRVSELINLSRGDVMLGAGAHVRCMGKGRKERATPIRKDSLNVLRDWLAEHGGAEKAPLFTSIRGDRFSRDAIERIVRKHVETAASQCPSLKKKRVTPHVLRHSAAMQLLQNGVDRTVIALWLGHESVETTQMYIHADIQLKEKAMARTAPVTAPPGRYRPDDKLLAFLEAL